MIQRVVGGAAAAVALLVCASAAQAFDPAAEAQNYSKGGERAAIYSTPEYQALLRQVGVQNRLDATAMQAADPERDMLSHLCSSGEDGCAGDARLYNWASSGYGIVRKVPLVMSLDGRLEPFCALYLPPALERLEGFGTTARASVIVGALPLHAIEVPDPVALLNVNRPEDLLVAAAALAERG